MLALTVPAIVLSLGCGLALAAADYFRKAVPERVPAAVVLFYFLLIQIPFLAAWAWFDPTDRPSIAALGSAYWVPTAADVAASLAGNALFIVAVRRSPLTMVIPLLALIPAITLLFGTVLLGEWPSLRQGAGLVIVTAGVFVLYLPEGAGLRPGAVWANFRAERGAVPMLAVAVSWALTAPLDKLAVAEAGVSLHAVIQVSCLWVAVAGWLLLRPGPMGLAGRLRLGRGDAGAIVGAALTAGLSYGLQLAAYRLTMVAFVEALKRVAEIGATVLIGALVFGERLSPGRLLAIGMIVVGVPLILLPGG
jgi:drug/metabolite transporter (DMT)-like permease